MAKKIELKIPRDEERELADLDDRLQELVDAALGDQPLKANDRRLLDKIYERLDIFEQSNRFFHDEAKKCRRILHMDDPDQDDAETVERNGKSTLQLQTLKSTINNVVADQMLSMPEPKLLPETAGMQDAADDLQDMVHYVIYCANNFEQMHYLRCEDFYGPGTAVTQVTWDETMNYGKGEIALIRWPIEAFLWDPTAENIQDCRAVMKVSWHPRSWYLEHWPDEGRYVVCDEHSHNDVGMTEGQEDANHSADEDRALLIEYWWREFNAETKRYSINVAYAAGNALLSVDRDVYDHGLYPFVIDTHDHREGNLVGDGLVRELAPMMRYINRYAAYIDMNLRMSSKGRLLIRRESGIDVEALADWKNDIIEGNNITPENIMWLQTTPFNGAITQMMMQLQTDLKQDSGANQFTRGETTGGIVSGKAINSLIQAGGKVAALRTEQLKYGFKQIVEQIIWLMSQFYDDDRVVMITGRKQEIHVDTERLFGKKTNGAVNPPPYTVQIEVSSRDPQRIANQNQMFMEAYTMSAQAQQFFPLSSLFQMLNLDGKDKVLPVIRENEHYQEQMQQMQAQLEQTQAQLDKLAKDNENLKQANTQMSNTIAQTSARTGGVSGMPEGMPQAGGEMAAENPIIGSQMDMSGVQTGAELPA